MISRILPLLFAAALARGAETFIPDIAANASRPWPGKDFWANPAEDWATAKGRIENTFSGGNRNLVLLTAELGAKREPFTVRTELDQVSFELFGNGYVGFQIGLQGPHGDYRDAAIAGAGFPAGIDFSGQPFIGDTRGTGTPLALPLQSLVLEFKGEPAEAGTYDLSLLVQDPNGKILGTVRSKADESWLRGLVAVASSTKQATTPRVLAAKRPDTLAPLPQERDGEGRFAFSKLELAGAKFELHPERAFGPVLWATYTFDNDGTLCVLAQCAAFAPNERVEVELQVAGRDSQKVVMDPASRTARFRILKLDPAKDHPYELKLGDQSFKGIAKAAPANRAIKIASLAGNGGTGLDRAALVANVKAQAPDFITFLGDQISAESGGYGTLFDRRPNDRAILCYLRKYAIHGWTWRDLLRDTPSVTLPDAEDIFQSKLWGTGGKAADASAGYGTPCEDSGGYKMSVEFVNAVLRCQTGNLPDPGDPSPCRSGINVFFTRHSWGPLDFVILSDRQFKSAPKPLFPQGSITNGWSTSTNWDPKSAVAADLDLLGIRQENFLSRWAKAPAKGAHFRIALSQTPLCAAETLPTHAKDDSGVPELPIFKPGQYPPEDEAKPDFDTNGWPQAPRLKALKLLAEAHAVHLCGDRNLGMTGQYGLGSWGDGPFWVSAPSIENPWPRRWMPATAGKNPHTGAPKYTGDFEDGFGNPVSIHAVANPQDSGRGSAFQHAEGYTITLWEPSGRVKIENWPAWASPAQAAPDNKPYEGWPVTIDPASGKRVE